MRDSAEGKRIEDWEMLETVAPASEAARLAKRRWEATRGASRRQVSEREVWREAYRRQLPAIERWGARQYLDGFARLGLPGDRVPTLTELNAVLEPLTGWTTLRTSIRYSDAEPWYRSFARRRFLVTDYMRSMEELEFTPEPDMFHDIFGHLPYLTLPDYTRLIERFAPAFLRAGASRREEIKRLAWFTTEFGLVREGSGIKAFGAGLISSIGELESVMTGGTRLEPFSIEAVLARDKAIWSHNDVLFVAESMAAMEEELALYFETL